MTKDEFVSLQLQYHQSGKSLKQFLSDTGIFYSNVSISHLFLCCAERSNFSANVNVEAYPQNRSSRGHDRKNRELSPRSSGGPTLKMPMSIRT